MIDWKIILVISFFLLPTNAEICRCLWCSSNPCFRRDGRQGLQHCQSTYSQTCANKGGTLIPVCSSSSNSISFLFILFAIFLSHFLQ